MFLRRLQESDLKTRVMWMNNEAVYPSMGFTPPISLDKTINWFHNNLNNDKRIDCVFINEAGESLAMGGLTNIDYSSRKAELYIFVHPNRQRQGIGKDATYLLCKYGFEVLHLNKIYLFTNESNVGAQKTYRKVGFSLEGTLRAERVTNGKYENRLYFGLLASELDYNYLNLIITGDNPLILCDLQAQIGGVNSIKIVRDDLFPFVGGGNKARKAIEYESFFKENNFNAIVTCGGVQSNHNRAMALIAAKNKWKCHLCIHDSQNRFFSEKGNALLDRLFGATCELIEPDDTSVAMDRAIRNLTQEGYNPYYVHGGGHDLPGGVAFVKAIVELKRRCEQICYKPDYIFHASGTGSTQAGILVGLNLVGWDDVKVIGISVARQQDRGCQVISQFANELGKYYHINYDFSNKVNFNTDYLFGGYEKYSSDMEIFIAETIKETGIIFDTTYSGKAFYGMTDMIKKNAIFKGKNILFWHTGGIMNIQK